MFFNNKYTECYYRIINKAIDRTELIGYSEKHHIIPKSLGGSNEVSNLVKLTAREHFICHLLLLKMLSGINLSKMCYAAWQLSRSAKLKGININNRLYAKLRKQLSESLTGQKRKPFSEQAKKNISIAHMGSKNYMYGRKHSPETIIKIKANIPDKSGKNNPFYGKTHSPETIAIIAQKSSATQKGIPKPKSPCKYCGVLVAANIMKRYHGDNCKLKSNTSL